MDLPPKDLFVLRKRLTAVVGERESNPYPSAKIRIIPEMRLLPLLH